MSAIFCTSSVSKCSLRSFSRARGAISVSLKSRAVSRISLLFVSEFEVDHVFLILQDAGDRGGQADMGVPRGARDRPRPDDPEATRRGQPLRGLPGLGRAALQRHGRQGRCAPIWWRRSTRCAGCGGRWRRSRRWPTRCCCGRSTPTSRAVPARGRGASRGPDAAAADQERRRAARSSRRCRSGSTWPR